jgi:hypothetical protein
MTQPIHHTNASGRRSAVRATAFLLVTLVMTGVSAQQTPTTGYAPVNGINMYYHPSRTETCQGEAGRPLHRRCCQKYGQRHGRDDGLGAQEHAR